MQYFFVDSPALVETDRLPLLCAFGSGRLLRLRVQHYFEAGNLVLSKWVASSHQRALPKPRLRFRLKPCGNLYLSPNWSNKYTVDPLKPMELRSTWAYDAFGKCGPDKFVVNLREEHGGPLAGGSLTGSLQVPLV